MNRAIRSSGKRALLAITVLIASVSLAQAGPRFDTGVESGGGAHSPGVVLSPVGTPYGKTYAEWSAAHWKWLFSIPVASNPANDFTGANFAEGQSGPVWFLAGSFCPEPPATCSNFNVTRNCTVPAGTALFFPILDAECSTLEGNGTTDAELRACAASFMDLGTGLACEVDGVPITSLGSYRVQSPLFTYGPLPDGNILGSPAGSKSPSVSDGVFLMLAPLSAGAHVVHFTAAIPSFGFGMDITYHLTVMGTSRVVTGSENSQASPASTRGVSRRTWGQLKTWYR